jgi:acyl dehydratase
MADQIWFEDLRVGATFAAPDVVVDEAAFDAFAGLTGDAHPMHYDPAFSTTTRFGKPVAHGLHLLALTALGATEVTDAMRDTVIAFASVSARFLAPVFPGDVLSRRASVVSLEPRNPGQGWVRMRATLHRADVLVLEAEHAYLWKRRPS